MAGALVDTQIDVNADASQAVRRQEWAATFTACLFMALAMFSMFAVARSSADIWPANLVVVSWILSIAVAVLALPFAAATGLEVMKSWYDFRGWPWLRKHSAANTATPPGELHEAQQKVVKGVMKNQKTAQITSACCTLVALLYVIVIRTIKYPTPHDWVIQVPQGIFQLGLCISALSSGYQALPQICDAYDWEWMPPFLLRRLRE